MPPHRSWCAMVPRRCSVGGDSISYQNDIYPTKVAISTQTLSLAHASQARTVGLQSDETQYGSTVIWCQGSSSVKILDWATSCCGQRNRKPNFKIILQLKLNYDNWHGISVGTIKRFMTLLPKDAHLLLEGQNSCSTGRCFHIG